MSRTNTWTYDLYLHRIKVSILLFTVTLIFPGSSVSITHLYFPGCNNLQNTDFCGSDFLQKCISHEYFGDGIVNCPFSTCTDETDCSSVYRNLMNIDPLAPCLEGDLSGCDIATQHGTSTNTKVTAGAVASLLLSFVIFVVCVWLCKKYGKLCFSDDCTNPSRNNQVNIWH